MFSLKGRVAVVTGAAQGLGVGIAKALARQGANLALLDRLKDQQDGVAEEIRSMGVECLSIKADLTKIEDIHDAVAAVVDRYGKVDILVNNAGGGIAGPAENMKDEDWISIIQLDLTAVFQCSREFGKIMLENGYGRIINIASAHGLVGCVRHKSACYQAAKGGVVNLTRSLGAEWASRGVTVNCICPGYFYTEITERHFKSPNFQEMLSNDVPMLRPGSPEELDGPIVFLASEESSYVTGVSLPVDGGYVCI